MFKADIDVGVEINELLTKLSLILPLALGKAQTRMLKNELNGDIRSCLDVGCGPGRFKHLKHFYSVGCDIHQPTLLKAEKRGYYNKLVECDACHLPFESKSFDAVISTELLEHLSKADGEKFIEETERVACKKVIITTPWGFAPQRGVKGNPYQVHISGWTPRELQKRGYTTYPFYCFRHPAGNNILKIIIKHGFTVLLYPLTRLFPEKFAIGFVAIKAKC